MATSINQLRELQDQCQRFATRGLDLHVIRSEAGEVWFSGSGEADAAYRLLSRELEAALDGSGWADAQGKTPEGRIATWVFGRTHPGEFSGIENLPPGVQIGGEAGNLFDLTAAAIGSLIVELTSGPATAPSKQATAPATALDVGISLRDIALHMTDNDDECARDTVRRWSNSKRITAKPIGKCPIDGRAALYRLSEILDDIKKVQTLSPREVIAYRQALTAKERAPAAE